MNQSLARHLSAPLPRRMKAVASRQQARTDATRRKLLVAAERIFARDGFEAARLEDIAGLAGYTRGAFYANFQSKEDIFFALLERWVGQRILEVDVLLAQRESPAKLLRALREHYAQITQDRRLALLSLEFKLFAIRHPEAHARLRARQRRLRVSGGDLLRRIARVAGRTLPISCTAAAAGFGALSSALSLEHFVDPSMVSEQETRHLLVVFFDAILGTKPTR
ncbi:MAG TPA: TetR/AcrR family transcriptional regulator [Candidatus Acidoferrales bacterium]|jgi:AcrR family transcriptional regulator|nr:TetR/AcrR family transcriptional regulator [Candidatus Acidoferrales bacterium]